MANRRLLSEIRGGSISTLLFRVLFLSPSIFLFSPFKTAINLTEACTVFLAGKNATKDGSVLVSHSNDGEFNTDPRLVKIPSADYPAGSQRPIYFSPESYPRYVGYERGDIAEYHPRENQELFLPIGYIPQVQHTYAYLEQTYGAINEHQVGIGESTCSGVFGAIPLGHPNGTALLSIDELSQIAMERAKTAKGAVQIMGDLAVEYGFYGAGSFEGTSESLAVSDPNEAWIFHILPDPTGKSAIWVSQRLPESHFSVIANMFIIREIDPTDSKNFLMSNNVHSIAQECGWWNPNDGTLLDFTATYSDGEYAHKYYSGRRVWRSYQLTSPSLKLPSNYTNLLTDKIYPVSAKPEKLLDVNDFFKMHRDTYEGTEFDLSAKGNLAGGPFGTPDRWKASPTQNSKVTGGWGSWERSIGLYRTTDTHVVQSRSWSSISNGGLGGILWFGPSSALGTVFTPFVVGLKDVPSSFRSGHQKQFDRTTMFWAAVFVHNVCNLKWSYMVKDVRKRQHLLERNSTLVVAKADEAQARAAQAREQARSQDQAFVAAEAEKMLLDNVNDIVSSLWLLSDELIFQYADGFVNSLDGSTTESVGYPTWWLNQVGYTSGPPPVPPRPNEFMRLATTVEEAVSATGKVAMKKHLESLVQAKES